MLKLLLWRKVSSSVILPLIPFVFHCISCRKLECVGEETGPWFISFSPAEVGAAVLASTVPPPMTI